MKRSLVLAFLFACAVVLAAWSSGVSAMGPGRVPYIVGGEVAKPGELPSLVLVAYLIPNEKKEVIFCTGTVIAPRLVLTAAHCAHPEGVHYGVDNFRVVAGNVNWKAHGRRVIHVVETMNPGRRFRHHIDAALLELAKPARVPSLPLASRTFWAPRSEAEMAGWGVLHRRQHDVTYVLHRAPTTVLGYAECNRNRKVSARLCAEDTASHRTSACYGDSGGPLLIRRPGDRRLVEIGVIHGGDYCKPGSPTRLTSTMSIYNWVQARRAEVGKAP